jgi:ABC-type transport system involved in cytochrome bd biosynthesis fused ATPase/permease subunit
VRNTIVLVTTVVSIEAAPKTVAILTFLTFGCYYYLLRFFRSAEETLIRMYPVYKNEFVKVFDEVIEGAQMIAIFQRQEAAIHKAQAGYVNVAAFKLTSQTVQIAEEAICELAGTLIIALGLEFGTKAKLQVGDQNEALIAVSVMLLLNLSEVLKTIMKSFMKLETFFRLKLLSVIELIDLEPPSKHPMVSRP